MAWQTLPCFITPNIKAEINNHTEHTMQLCSAEFRVSFRADPELSLVVWTLKREVRAFGGCLGMYRR